MADGDSKEDWEIPMEFEVDGGKLSLAKLEKAVRAGFKIERDGDRKKATVVGRVVIQGNEKKDLLDVSK